MREWIKERVAIPEREWFAGVPIPSGVERRVFGNRAFIIHPELALGEDAVRQAAEILQFYGPKTPAEAAGLLPFANAADILRELVELETLVQSALVADEEQVLPVRHGKPGNPDPFPARRSAAGIRRRVRRPI